MTSNTKRQEALLDLVELRTTVVDALERLSAFGGPTEDPGVTLTVRHLSRALDDFDARALDEADLVAWAEAVHGREDIEVDPVERDLLADALFELSTPELFGPMTQVVSEIRRRLS